MKNKYRMIGGKIAKITGDMIFLVILVMAVGILIPTVSGYALYEVASDSMEPDYARHALLYVKKMDASELKKGDVITFYQGKQTEKVVTHRIEKVDAQNEVFQTKGDANNTADIEKVSFSQVIGKVELSIPQVGRLINIFQEKIAISVIVGLLVIGVILYSIGTMLFKKEDKRTDNKGKISLFFIIGVFLVIFSGYQLIKIGVQYREGKEEYTTVVKEYTKQKKQKKQKEKKSGISEKKEPVREKWETRFIDFQGLQAINSEVIGWIAFDDGEIDYPIMQAKDDKKYLKVTFEGKQNPCGAIFLEQANAKEFTDSYSLVYGHNMKNRTMFGNLRDYKTDENYWKEHRFFTIYTPKDIRRYEIFSFADVSQNSEIYTIGFQESELFQDFLQNRKQESYVDTGISVGKKDKIVALSTCSSEKMRFVVMGKLQKTVINQTN